MRSSTRSALVFSLSLAAGCGGGSSTATMDASVAADLAPPPPDYAFIPPTLGTPIPAATNSDWAWIDVEGSACWDGAQTGMAVSFGTSKNVLFFLNGGGACWNYSTCFTLMTATLEAGKDQFTGMAGSLKGSIFDRTLANNPFKDWNMVFVPYCTGDVHSGNNVATYSSSGDTKTFHHVGRVNMEKFAARAAATWPDAAKVMVSGSSAGGYGAGLNYDLVHRYWPSQKVYLIDDSGPPFVADDILPGFRDAWVTNWNMSYALDTFCDGCEADLSLSIVDLAARWPHDRGALLSSQQDQTISGYLVQSPATFELALSTLDGVIDPIPNFHYFEITGNTHTMLGDPGSATYTSGTVNLWDWINLMVSDDDSWKSLAPAFPPAM